MMIRYLCCLLLVTGGLLFAGTVWADETVCIQCHGGMDGRLGAPVDEWRGSVHAKNGISCHDCHGGDPTDFSMAMSPERGFIGVPEYTEVPDFCGRCHVGVKQDYLASAHGKALADGGPQCVVCHGNHAVQMADPSIINKEDCSRCHDYGRAEEIKSAVMATDQMLEELSSELQRLGKKGIAVDDMKNATFALRNDFHQLFHTVDVEKVRKQTDNFQERGAKIEEKISTIQAELAQRRMWGGVVAGLLFLASAIAFLIRKNYKKEEDSQL